MTAQWTLITLVAASATSATAGRAAPVPRLRSAAVRLSGRQCNGDGCSNQERMEPRVFMVIFTNYHKSYQIARRIFLWRLLYSCWTCGTGPLAPVREPLLLVNPGSAKAGLHSPKPTPASAASAFLEVP